MGIFRNRKTLKIKSLLSLFGYNRLYHFIQGCVQEFIKLLDKKSSITDNNFYFIFFVQTLEKIFNNGLIRQQNTKYFNRTIDVYAWMASIAKSENNMVNLTYKSCVELVKDRSELYSNDGRLRLLIKYCLVKKCLHIPVEFMIKQNSQIFYSPSSIMGDEILSEILLSVLRQVSQIPFALDLRNSSFLDISWYVPKIIDIELVPCKSLGIAVSFAGNKAIIVNIQPESVAAENGNIKLGDVLEQLNSININKNAKGRLGLIMKSNKNKPVSVRIAKAYDSETKTLYGPIESLLKELAFDLDTVKRQYEENGNEINDTTYQSIYGYAVKYLAKVDVGSMGNVKQVQKAIRCLNDIHSTDFRSIERLNKIVSLEIGEIGLKIRDKVTCDIISEHAYMKISSCGNIPILPKIFGYCSSEENCDVAKNFTCHIFETISFDDADTILQSIGQGFHRTHFAV